MLIRSLGYRTDLFFVRQLGEIGERHNYLVARMPSNPTFHWGNFLLYSESPSPERAQRWQADFVREFPEASHIAIGWHSGSKGEPGAFLGNGFDLHDLVVMCAARVRRPPHLNASCSIRPLQSDAEWEAACENGIRNREEIFGSEDTYRPFRTARMRDYRRLQERGFGFCYGAFVDGKLVGELGIFGEQGIARYQQVGVDKDHRRQGICKALMWRAAEHFATTRDLTQFVIVTEANNEHHTQELYASLGFEACEAQWGVSKRV